MRQMIKDHKAAAAAIAALGVVFAAWLAFGVFGVHTLFTDTKVNESGPVFDSPATTTAPTETVSDDSQPETSPPDTSSESVPTSPTTTEASGGVETLAQGSFSGADASHDVAGDAIVLGDGSEQRFLRFENFEATNGPDLKVYLRAADGEFVSLGDLKGNIGDQNYEIPPEVDLATYNEVQIWCQRFSVNFGSAFLT